MLTDTLERTRGGERADRPLQHFPVISTDSLEEARDAVARVYLPHTLTGDERLDMTLNAVSDHHFTLGLANADEPLTPRSSPGSGA